MFSFISLSPSRQDKHYLCIMASDTPDQNISQYFSVCNDFIHAARLRDGNVLIHCLAGMSRSVTVTVAYIMSVTNLSWKEALKVVRTGRSVANPNLGFQMQLRDYELFKLTEVCKIEFNVVIVNSIQLKCLCATNLTNTLFVVFVVCYHSDVMCYMQIVYEFFFFSLTHVNK